jgi:hypothetical protein
MEQGTSTNKVVFLFFWRLVALALSHGAEWSPVMLLVKPSR